jgi:superfamily II DNA or RNA helicase
MAISQNILFSIQGMDKSENYLILSLIEEGAVKSKKIYLSNLLDKVKPDERKLIIDLAKEEIKRAKSLGIFESEETKDLSIIHIERSKVNSFLKVLAATSRLYYKSQKLLIDFFSKNEFCFEGTQEIDGSVKAKGFIKRKEEKIPFNEVDFIFASDPIFFIHKSRLSFLSNHPLSKWLVPEITLDETRQESFLQADEDSNYPKLFLLSQSNNSNYEIGPLPVLRLMDRFGSFANLEMDYSNCKKKSSPQDEKMWQEDLLQTDFIFKPQGSSSYFCPLDKVYKSLLFLMECGFTVIDFTGKKVVLKTDENFEYNLEGNKIHVKGNMNFGTFKAKIEDVALAFNRRQSFLSLSDSTSGLMDLNSQDYKELFDESEIVGQSLSKPLHACFKAFEQEKNHNALIKYDTSINHIKESYQSIYQVSELNIDGDFKGVLRTYQKIGVNWLLFLKEFGFGGILADEMGLGKTVQVLAFIAHFKEKKPILIVVPTSLIFNWQKEIQKFLPSRNCSIYQQGCSIQDSDILLISYAKLRSDKESFNKTSFALVVLDEAQMIKNPDTQIARAIFSLQADCRLSLTGTPIENSLNDLWSQYHFLMRDLLGEKESFEKIAKISFSDGRWVKNVKDKIFPFFLRRKKEEVAKDLPEKIEQTVYVEMSQEQKALYEKFLISFKSNLLKKVNLEGAKKHRLEIFEAILRLRQIAVHPLLVSPEEAIDPSCGKWEVLVSDIHTVVEEGKKVLVYSQFTGALKLLKDSLSDLTSKIVYLDGSTKDRSLPCKQFQEDPNVQVFLISLKAGGVGLNLTKADYVFLLDPWWNVAVENQAIDRAHRIGREGVVIAKRYVSLQSIEEKMMTLKEAKKKIVEDIFKEESEDKDWSFDDLEFLFS